MRDAMIRGLIACVALAVAACGPAEPPPAHAPDPAAAEKLGPAEPLDAALPTAAAPLRFVGGWATTANQCGSPPWSFRADGVSTQGEVSCTFNDIDEITGGYTIQASCSAEGNDTEEQIQLTFAESAQAMMVSGGPWMGAIALVHCGP